MINILTNCVNVLGTDLYDLIQEAFKIIKICVPILVVVLISIDMLSCVTAGDEEKMKAAQNRSVKRLIIGVVIFFIPTFVNLIIKYSNSDIQACWGEEYDQISENLKVQKSECEALNNSSSGIKYKWNNLNEECVKESVTDVIYYYQGDYNDAFCSGGCNISDNGCGVTSLAMVASTLVDKSYTPPVVAKWMCNNGAPGCGMGMYEMLSKKATASHFGLNSRVLFTKGTAPQYNYGTTYNYNEATSIYNAVISGELVIILVPNHFVTIGLNNKCSSGQVYLYDPGWTAQNGCYTMKELYNKTYNRNNRCTNKGWCGWGYAIAYSAK